MKIELNNEKYWRSNEDNQFVERFTEEDSTAEWEDFDDVEVGKLSLNPDINDMNMCSFFGDLFIKELANFIAEESVEELLDFVENNESMLIEVVNNNEDVARMLIIAYKMGIEHENGECANNLGALYYSGNGVDQDYNEAKELYKLGAAYGSIQAQLNLGYIYEYGRTGKPDYDKAYMCYSVVAACNNSYEALYKMGDMFSRGKPFGKDIRKAYKLWLESLKIAYDPEEESQAAIRIAKLVIDETMEYYGIEYNPMLALSLYQKAEIGLRISIDKGLTYYKKRLQEAIDGQAKARQLLNEIIDS